jgi:hypothetical protein
MHNHMLVNALHAWTASQSLRMKVLFEIGEQILPIVFQVGFPNTMPAYKNSISTNKWDRGAV